MPHYRSPAFAAVARAFACACILALTDFGHAAFALTFTVNTLADTSSGNTATGSLRDGLNAVNATTDLVNTISFQPGLTGNITLSGALPLVLNDVVIDGTGASIAIDGASTYRIFFVGVDLATATLLQSQFPNSPSGRGTALAVTLRKLTLQNGNARGGTGAGGGMGAGGALFVNGSTSVTLDSVSFTTNKAKGGAGGSGHDFAAGGGLGGNGMVDATRGGGGGGIFGDGGSGGGGGVFGSGNSGGGGFSGAGGGAGNSGASGSVTLAGMSGTGGGGFGGETGGGNGGGGGGDATGGGGGGGFAGANGTSTQSGNGGFGGGGGGSGPSPGGAHIVGGTGGFGGGGGNTYNVFNTGGGPGGFGGGGGGGSQTAGQTGGGHGGFGGGGGSGYGYAAGSGGFGGGGGSSLGTVGASGGFGGGNGSGFPTSASNGGGGAGFGGAVFVVAGGVLTIQGSAVETGGVVTAGASGGAGAGIGSAAGSGFFMHGTGALGFALAAGQTQTIADSIADEVGSGIANPPSTGDIWALSKSGPGTLVLGGTNAYAGNTSVSGGILRVTGDIKTSALYSVDAPAILTGTGKVRDVDLYGTIAPGTKVNTTGVLEVFHTILMESGARACFHADGVGNASRILVTPTGGNPIGDGAAFLSGVARIDFSAGPQAGAQYVLVSAGIIGTFSGFETNVSGLVGQLNYSGTQVTFTVTANDTIFGNSFEAPLASESACIAAFAN